MPDASIDEPGHDSSSSSHSSDAQVVAVVASDVQAKVVQGLSGPSHSQLSEAESEEVAKELAVRSSTATSWWWALLTLLRVSDKVRDSVLGSSTGPCLSEMPTYAATSCPS